jgi:hypothetical protein
MAIDMFKSPEVLPYFDSYRLRADDNIWIYLNNIILRREVKSSYTNGKAYGMCKLVGKNYL